MLNNADLWNGMIKMKMKLSPFSSCVIILGLFVPLFLRPLKWALEIL